MLKKTKKAIIIAIALGFAGFVTTVTASTLLVTYLFN